LFSSPERAAAWGIAGRGVCRARIACRHYRTQSRATQRAAEEMDRNGAQVFAWPGDIRRRDHKRWGDVQILINNAGVAQAVNFTDMRDEARDIPWKPI